ncbi:MAG: ATP-binding protein [Limnochordia bacterium]|jgi:predicted transcriptional regulator
MGIFSRFFGPKKEQGEPAAQEVEARIAIYDSPGVSPRLVYVQGTDPASFMDEIASTTYNLAKEKGGQIPFTALKEIAENLIHADFSEVVITISTDGNTITFSDKGKGIADKEKALYPGYSSADGKIKAYIKGVGSGLPVAKEAVAGLGGKLLLDDNLQGGAVVTLTIPDQEGEVAADLDLDEEQPQTLSADSPPIHPAAQNAGLSRRQETIFFLLADHGEIGPSAVARQAGISLSTAYRDLVFLEQLGLLEAKANGKRVVTAQGQALLKKMRAQHR